MNKYIFIAIIMFFNFSALYAANIGPELNAVKQLYSKGDFDGAIAKLDEIKLLISQEQANNSGEKNYISVKNWDAIKIEPEEYNYKSIKINLAFGGIEDSRSVTLIGIDSYCSFENSLKSKLISLTKNQRYTFYGYVKIDSQRTPWFHIERIQ